jgi:hypothetical protein
MMMEDDLFERFDNSELYQRVQKGQDALAANAPQGGE